jgi:hypothetical protein
VIARVHRAPFIAVIAMGLLAVGCGSGRSTTHASTHAARRPPRASANPAPPPVHALPTPGPTGVPAAAAAIGVIRAWSDALRQGDVRDAARYFALPSVMVNGSVGAGTALVITIETRAQAEAANVSLPCGARFVSADQRGRYVNALFALTGRPGPGGSDCGTGVGQTARTNFVIAHGRIIEWLRAPDDPGDNGTPGVPTPTTPPSPQAPGATV